MGVVGKIAFLMHEDNLGRNGVDLGGDIYNTYNVRNFYFAQWNTEDGALLDNALFCTETILEFIVDGSAEYFTNVPAGYQGLRSGSGGTFSYVVFYPPDDDTVFPDF
jgi:hypothetical protein